MHEYEDVVEDSIKMLAKNNFSELRDYCFNLYSYQEKFDTSYTHFRLIDTLIEAGFVYKINIEDHPEYSKFKTDLDKLKNEKSSWLTQDPSKGLSGDNHGVAYWQSPFLYLDAGSFLWEKLVQCGFYKDRDRLKPKSLPWFEVLLEVFKQAEAAGDTKLISTWYLLTGVDILMSRELFPKEDIFSDAKLKEIYDIVVRTKAYEVKSEYRMLQFSKEDMLEYLEDEESIALLNTWFKPIWS